MAKTGMIVLDAGHGGQVEVGNSSANNAISPSGVLEKNITLRMAFLVREQLNTLAQQQGHQLTIMLTRESDINLGLAARANIAKSNNANLFLCIHCNASTGHNARGTETFVSPVSDKNINIEADRAYAQLIQQAVFKSILSHDSRAKDRGVKENQSLGVLKDRNLGEFTRGCLVELEFIDIKAVDELLNIGPNAIQVRTDIANAIAKALIDAL